MQVFYVIYAYPQLLEIVWEGVTFRKFFPQAEIIFWVETRITDFRSWGQKFETVRDNYSLSQIGNFRQEVEKILSECSPAGDLLSYMISKELISYLLVRRQFSESGTKLFFHISFGLHFLHVQTVVFQNTERTGIQCTVDTRTIYDIFSKV